MNQGRTESIVKYVIIPLEAMFGEFKKEAKNIIIDDLQRYDDKVLEMGAKKVCREVKSFPKLSHIVDACEACKPFKPKEKADKDEESGNYCRGHAETYHPQIAEKILSSSAGQYALKEGVASDVLLQYERTGRTEFDFDFVRKCKTHLLNAAQEVAKLNPEDNAYYKTIMGLYEAMRDREKRLYLRFFKEQRTA